MRRGLSIGRISAYHPPDQARPGMSALQRRKEGQRPKRASARPSHGSPRDGSPLEQQRPKRHRSGAPSRISTSRRGRSRRPAVEAYRRHGRLREVFMTQARQEAISQDTRDLHKLGYAQELYRSMGGFSNFAISFSIISILTGAVILYNYGLSLGGPAAVGIGWPLVTVFTLMIAATMAELASAYPTAGGLYYWASKLRNKDWGWWTAWLNLGGQVSIVAGINYSAAFYLSSTILNPLFGIDPNVETAGVLNAIWITGILIFIEILFNVAGTKIVAFMNDLSVWWHIFFVAAIALTLFAFGSQPTHDLGFLFTVAPGTNADGVSWSSVVPFGVAGA